MSQYTTRELAKQCKVTVRTVQFYDQRGILVPSALTEGGRRLSSEADVKKMKNCGHLGFCVETWGGDIK